MKAIAKNLSGVFCADCQGWPIPGGSMFIPIALLARELQEAYNPHEVRSMTARERIEKGTASAGFLCELCFLRRLQHRAHIVTRTSSGCFQIPREVHRLLDKWEHEVVERHKIRKEPSGVPTPDACEPASKPERRHEGLPGGQKS